MQDMRHIYLVFASSNGFLFGFDHHLDELIGRLEFIFSNLIRHMVRHIAVDGFLDVLLVVHMITLAEGDELFGTDTDADEEHLWCEELLAAGCRERLRKLDGICQTLSIV